MPYNELLILLSVVSDRRSREKEEYELRDMQAKFIAWHAMVGSHLNPKAIPDFNSFTGQKKKSSSRATEGQRELFKKAFQEYQFKKEQSK